MTNHKWDFKQFHSALFEEDSGDTERTISLGQHLNAGSTAAVSGAAGNIFSQQCGETPTWFGGETPIVGDDGETPTFQCGATPNNQPECSTGSLPSNSQSQCKKHVHWLCEYDGNNRRGVPVEHVLLLKKYFTKIGWTDLFWATVYDVSQTHAMAHGRRALFGGAAA